MRKLASIRRIDAISPIEGADAIECATVGGWQLVIKKGEFTVGDLAVYLEIDSWVPHELAPFLSKGKEPREFNGMKGERLRTVKLRGQVSQGLLLPLSVAVNEIGNPLRILQEGEDVSNYLGIQKWEAPIPAQLAGIMRGNFPSFIPKTDQERIQNLDILDLVGVSYEVTEKLDGSSMTVYVNGEDEGVCSRNIDLKRDENNTFWKVAIAENLHEKIRGLGNLALQGELIGEGIQGNPYKLQGQRFYLFDVWDIDAQEYLSPIERTAFANNLGISHVPVLDSEYNLTEGVFTLDLLKNAEGKSQLNASTEREGVVYKSNDSEVSWKAISNKFLLKEK